VENSLLSISNTDSVLNIQLTKYSDKYVSQITPNNNVGYGGSVQRNPIELNQNYVNIGAISESLVYRDITPELYDGKNIYRYYSLINEGFIVQEMPILDLNSLPNQVIIELTLQNINNEEAERYAELFDKIVLTLKIN
jgi:hypothetical protein